jgi:glycosyltransferase involved in cell wall biosynthesis
MRLPQKIKELLPDQQVAKTYWSRSSNMEITYIGACLDSSGYAEAARNNIAALHAVGVKQKVVPVSFEQQKANMGQLGELVRSLISQDGLTRIRILHATPPNYNRLIRKNHHNIGYAAWETDHLPKEWVPMINLLDEVWCPSTHNKETFERSGVNIPVNVIPHTFQIKEDEEYSVGGPVLNRSNNEFFFYSIFQWLERKNPVGLLKAYLTEFDPDENVTMVLKTFRLNAGQDNDTAVITRAIKTIKESMYLKKYPRLLLISSLMTRDQMIALHRQCDCYVSLNRCEGWGIPLTEAMLAGNPVIATSYGGAADFLSTETGYPVDYMLTPVAAMPWPMYTGYMNWAEPDLMQARKYMREVFENQEAAKRKGKLAKKWVKENLNWKTVGKLMLERLKKING